MHFLKQNQGLMVCTQTVFCRGDNVGDSKAPIGAICSICWGQLNVCWSPVAMTNDGLYSFSVFWCPQISDCASGVLFVEEALDPKFCTQFLKELSGTIMFPLLLKRLLNIRCITVTGSLFFKNVFNVSARYTAYYWLLNGVPDTINLISSLGPPEYYVNQNYEWTLPRPVF